MIFEFHHIFSYWRFLFWRNAIVFEYFLSSVRTSSFSLIGQNPDFLKLSNFWNSELSRASVVCNNRYPWVDVGLREVGYRRSRYLHTSGILGQVFSQITGLGCTQISVHSSIHGIVRNVMHISPGVWIPLVFIRHILNIYAQCRTALMHRRKMSNSRSMPLGWKRVDSFRVRRGLCRKIRSGTTKEWDSEVFLAGFIPHV